MTIQQIKADLREIRYYYSHEKELSGAIITIGKCAVMDKIETYNTAIRKATVQLYSLYVELYVQCNTQLNVALDWDCSVEHIKRLNKKLCEFLLNELDKKE